MKSNQKKADRRKTANQLINTFGEVVDFVLFLIIWVLCAVIAKSYGLITHHAWWMWYGYFVGTIALMVSSLIKGRVIGYMEKKPVADVSGDDVTEPNPSTIGEPYDILVCTESMMGYVMCGQRPSPMPQSMGQQIIDGHHDTGS